MSEPYPLGWPPGAQKWEQDDTPAQTGDTAAWYRGSFRGSFQCWALHYKRRVAELEQRVAELESDNSALMAGIRAVDNELGPLDNMPTEYTAAIELVRFLDKGSKDDE